MLVTRSVSLPRVATVVALLLAVALIAAGCGGSDDSESADAADSAELADVRRDAGYWQQLTALFEPVELASMTDHRAYMLPSGYLLALPFDNMDLDKAENLNWVALGVPGRFCDTDQKRVEAEFGGGFTHFHDLEATRTAASPVPRASGSCTPGVRDFESRMSAGPVTGGEIDTGFMPTPAPSCAK